jgi:hypothetical protein
MCEKNRWIRAVRSKEFVRLNAIELALGNFEKTTGRLYTISVLNISSSVSEDFEVPVVQSHDLEYPLATKLLNC